MDIRITKLVPHAVIPQYQTPGAAGFDLHASETIVIAPGEIALVHTGLVIAVPDGYFLLIASRSSTPRKKGLNMPHGIGVLDSDYRGPQDEVLLQVFNFTQAPVTVERGERIAQGLVVPVVQGRFVEGEIVQTESRGGFGSTSKS